MTAGTAIGAPRSAAVAGVDGAPIGAGPGDDGPGSRLEAWVAAYGGELERHLTRMLGRAEEAHDLLQEIWVTALRSPPDDGPGSNVRAWLYRVATNAALDRLAMSRRRRGLLEQRAPELEPDGHDAPDGFLAGLDPESRKRVRERVAELPRKQRDAVWLRWIDGLDYEVIAERLESSPEAARANVYQGMKKLRSSLFDLWQEARA